MLFNVIFIFILKFNKQHKHVNLEFFILLIS